MWCGFVVYRCHEGACGPHGCVRVGCACGCGSAETEAERDSQAKDNALCVWVWCEGPCVWAGCVCGVGGMGVCMCVWRAPVGVWRQEVLSETIKVRYQLLDKHRFISI